MSLIKDAIGIFNKRDLIFVEKMKQFNNIYTFIFEKDHDVTWEAGQHGLFHITHKKIKNSTRPFTISSFPSENKINITTKIGENPSDYKKELLQLKQGMKIKMNGPV